jgi:hypothetical protein
LYLLERLDVWRDHPIGLFPSTLLGLRTYIEYLNAAENCFTGLDAVSMSCGENLQN